MSLKNFECASNNPTAFVLLDPTAGAALAPSRMTLPLSCIRLRGLSEFAVETMLSAGLPGRSIVEVVGGVVGPGKTGCGIATEETEGEGGGMIDVAETGGVLEVGTGDIAFLAS